ncbi:MAG: hypothetical protein QOH48_1017 [Actinomycetota bacterium]|jgi:hypothetical protein|nr:hypothetical protein [Actinomycetota bacterium]
MESSDSEMRDQDAGFDDDPEADPGEQLEAVIEQADHPFGSESFGTTAEEGSRGESLDQRLAQERQSQTPADTALVIEDSDQPDEESEMLGDASLEHDPLLAPEEAAVHVRDEDRRRDS